MLLLSEKQYFYLYRSGGLDCFMFVTMYLSVETLSFIHLLTGLL